MEQKPKRVQPLLDGETYNKLDKLAKDNGAKVSPYAASVLKKHVSKQEVKPNGKKEYGK